MDAIEKKENFVENNHQAVQQMLRTLSGRKNGNYDAWRRFVFIDVCRDHVVIDRCDAIEIAMHDEGVNRTIHRVPDEPTIALRDVAGIGLDQVNLDIDICSIRAGLLEIDAEKIPQHVNILNCVEVNARAQAAEAQNTLLQCVRRCPQGREGRKGS